MNKAFVREPDRLEEYCPRCGSKGEPVGRETLANYLTEEQRGRISATANFCPSASCPVGYFDAFERIVRADELRQPAYPKDRSAPICACFGLTEADIEQDVAEGGVTRTRAVIQKAQSPEACCARLAANGQSCVAYVQKYYLRCRSERDG